MFFGFFQAFMPLIGYLGGANLQEYIQGYDKVIAFVLLLLIGGKMIYEAYGEKTEDGIAIVSNRVLFILAVATSIDAMAAGFTLHLFDINIFLALFIIGFSTFAISAFGVYIGKKGGSHYESKAEIFGGAVLILIGFKILFF